MKNQGSKRDYRISVIDLRKPDHLTNVAIAILDAFKGKRASAAISVIGNCPVPNRDLTDLFLVIANKSSAQFAFPIVNNICGKVVVVHTKPLRKTDLVPDGTVPLVHWTGSKRRFRHDLVKAVCRLYALEHGTEITPHPVRRTIARRLSAKE